jgi:hypothetical protein
MEPDEHGFGTEALKALSLVKAMAERRRKYLAEFGYEKTNQILLDKF